MNFKISLAKAAIKWTPKKLISWVANIILKDIAEVKELSFDLDVRSSYVQIQLVGESETIDIWLEDFAIISNEDSYKLVIKQARSNRIWLGNILSRIIKKEWDIPVPSQMTSQFEFIAELLKAETPEQEAS
ncbi:MAG: hypothetical protein GQ529_03935 [Methyloprofundus sp.]|nr:hypothetical protein [Methyloprofundus sp.]